MKLSKKEREVLCVYHAHIRSALNEIESCMRRTDITAGVDAVTALQNARQNLAAATEAGMSMENRLLEYRNAIESLGFARAKKSKTNSKKTLIR